MSRAALIVVVALLAGTGGVAAAQPGQRVTEATETARRDRVVSLALPALQGFGGIAAQAEQLLPERRISLVAGLGVRSSAGEDFGSRTLSLGGEARYWFTGRALWTRLPERSMVGWFTGARLDVAWTDTRDRVEDRDIGSNLGLAVTATSGYRIAIRRRVEVTPSLGLGLTTEIDPTGRLPALVRGTLRLGLTAGWMF
ncbi:MAG TPA: hypothetical protein VML75_22120 [Kofleriaceae bacterium]|nr:hypothetical protein [Kofleriaceae bacterium]